MLNVLAATVIAVSVFQQVSSIEDGGAATTGDLGGNPLVFSGRDGRLEVSIPKVPDPDINIDGRLDDAVWSTAAVLTDFTQYEPVEGLPSTEATQVRIFYSDVDLG